jgi:hypothetical protein
MEPSKKASKNLLDFSMTHTEMSTVVRTDSILAKRCPPSEHFGEL